MSLPDHLTTTRVNTAAIKVWLKRFLIALTMLAWLIFAGAILWVLGLVIGPIILVSISALLAYLFYPLVKVCQRFMPRPLAILVVCLLILVLVGLIFYFIVIAAVEQLKLLINVIQSFLQHPNSQGRLYAFIQFLNSLGISQKDFSLSGEQLVAYLQNAIGGISQFVSSTLGLLIDALVLATLSVYFLIDGPRVNGWLRGKMPLKYRQRVNYFLDTVEQKLGGFVRGRVLISTMISAIVGIGAYFIGLPYVILLVVIVFMCDFIPIIGAYISGVIGILFALTQGWQVALIYAVFVTFVQGILDGQILSPRIVGHSVGLHPIVAIFALLVGSRLFGLLGALFACPVAGIIQTFIVAFWVTWRKNHPEQFPEEVQQVQREGHEQGVVAT
jgi:predicted PurR-regulated permease PerM